jgi:hypothetical protein
VFLSSCLFNILYIYINVVISYINERNVHEPTITKMPLTGLLYAENVDIMPFTVKV